MEFLYALESIRSSAMDAVMSVITQLGGEMVYMAIAIVVFWCVSKGLGYYILTVGFAGTIVNQFLKSPAASPAPGSRTRILQSSRAPGPRPLGILSPAGIRKTPLPVSAVSACGPGKPSGGPSAP